MYVHVFHVCVYLCVRPSLKICLFAIAYPGVDHDPVMTFTCFRARSTWVAYAFEWEKLLKCHLKGKACRKLANEQDIMEKNGPRASSTPLLGLFSILFKRLFVYTCTADLR